MKTDSRGPETETWTEFIAPHVSRFRSSAIAGTDYVLNPVGCEAMAKILERMAAKLDFAVAAQTTKGHDDAEQEKD